MSFKNIIQMNRNGKNDLLLKNNKIYAEINIFIVSEKFFYKK